MAMPGRSTSASRPAWRSLAVALAIIIPIGMARAQSADCPQAKQPYSVDMALLDNAVRDYVQGRALVAEGRRADPALLADVHVPFKEI